MTDGFVRKKVESLTLGEKLAKLRTQYRMSLQDIAKATRIQVKYLEALESGDHRELPAEVYVRGFLRSYARYLSLEDDAFIKLYDKEKHIRSHLGKAEPVQKIKTLKFGKAWVITPRTIVISGIALILGGTCWYLFQELHAFVAEPHLIIETPAPGQVVTEGVVAIAGRTDSGAKITLNGESVFVDTEGRFQEKLTLQPGTNTLRILAINRFEKTKEVVLTLENSLPPAQLEPEAIPVEVFTDQALSRVTLEVDGVIVWNGPWGSGQREALMVKDRIRLSTATPTALFLQVGKAPSVPVAPAAAQEGALYGRAELTTLKNTIPAP